MILCFLDLDAVWLSFFELWHRLTQYVVDAGLPARASGFECFKQVGIDTHIECGSLLSQGGSAASAFDLCLVPKNINLSTISMTVNYLSPSQGIATSHGQVIRSGNSIAYAEGEVKNELGDIVCRVSASYRIIRPK